MEIKGIRLCGERPGKPFVYRLENAILERMTDAGFEAHSSRPTSTSIRIQNVRLNVMHVEKHGYNIHLGGYGNRRGCCLGWKDWVRVNNLVNDVLDEWGVWAHAFSLHGWFQIRDGMKAYTEADWERWKYHNVGSMMHPVLSVEQWQSEEHPRCIKHPRYNGEKPQRRKPPCPQCQHVYALMQEQAPERKLAKEMGADIEVRTIKQSDMSSECWMVQFQGTAACERCEYKGTADCGGKDILKTGENANGKRVPLGEAGKV